MKVNMNEERNAEENIQDEAIRELSKARYNINITKKICLHLFVSFRT